MNDEVRYGIGFLYLERLLTLDISPKCTLGFAIGYLDGRNIEVLTPFRVVRLLLA